MKDKVLVGYASVDLEAVAMASFFDSWKAFNRKLDRTITGVIPSLHDRIGLFHAYIAWKGTQGSSDNVIV